jgi:hypothetical protein
MTTLATLANELKHGIIFFLSFQDIISLSKTCRSLRTVAYPALYHTIKIDLAGETTHPQRPPNDAITNISKLNALLAMLVQRPGLIDGVRTIEADPAFPGPALITEEQIRMYEGITEDLDLPTMQFNMNDAEGTHSKPSIMLLIAICDKLDNLTLALGTCCSEEWPRVDIFAKATLTLRARSLKSLRLKTTAVPASWIYDVLQHTSRIETLEYDVVTYLDLDESVLVLQILDLPKLRAGLNLVHSTLKHLILRFEDKTRNCEDLGMLCRNHLGSLRNLTELVSLEVSFGMLFGPFGADTVQLPHVSIVLPAKLRRLTITDDFWGFETFSNTEGVATMAIFKRFFTGERLMEGWTLDTELGDIRWIKEGDGEWIAATPGLKEFVFDIKKRGWASYDYWGEAGPCEELQHMCESQGIHCEILRTDYND